MRRAEPAASGRKVASVAERKTPASPCAEWPPVPCDPGGGSVRQAIYETLQWRHASRFYSHSIVLGGLEEMSYTTRLIPLTSLMMRVEIR